MTTVLNPEGLRAAALWAQPLFDTPAVNTGWRAAPSDAERARQQATHQARAEGLAQGLAEGRAAGFAEGRAEGLAQAAAEVTRLRQILAALATPLALVDGEIERLLAAMTLEAARRIAQQELAIAPERIAAVIRDAVAALGGKTTTTITVRLNPADHGVLAPLLRGEGPGKEPWQLVADPDVAPGGCQVESEDASVLSSLDARAAGLAYGLLQSPGDGGGR